jgi:hypothetical protein
MARASLGTDSAMLLFPEIPIEKQNYLLDCVVGIRKGMLFITRECLHHDKKFRWENLAQWSSDIRSLVSVTGYTM